MKIDGKAIADEIKKDLINKVEKLKRQNIFPHLAVILIGSDPASITYVKRKELLAGEIGVKISIYKLTSDNQEIEPLIHLTKKLNEDKLTHGIIIQRPVPISISNRKLTNLVIKDKDVDGFCLDSPFNPPVAAAVLKILNYVFRKLHPSFLSQKHAAAVNRDDEFVKWLKKKTVLIIGRGETAGKPIADTFGKKGLKYVIAHSQTKNLQSLCLSKEIIISCVGKYNIVRQDYVSNKTILIGVGLHPENDKLQADYIQDTISQRTGFYTPVPGGVGPVNVACLFQNLIQAASKQTLDI